MAEKNKSKTATFTMKQKAPKKNSVLFESTDPNSPLTNVYVMRTGASQALGISDLDNVKEIQFTLEAK